MNQIKFHTKYRVSLAPTLQGHWYEVYEITYRKPSTRGLEGVETSLDYQEVENFLGYFPSSTTILNAYPQSAHLTKWIADNGFEEAAKIRDQAGAKGTKIHDACDRLEAGETLDRLGYSLEEWYKISTFVAWHKEYKPELIAVEIPVFSKKGKYAGRADRVYLIEGEYILLDLKSSQSLYSHFPLQFSSYAKAIEENSDIKFGATAALQLGANNKNGYRYEVYKDWKKHYKVFEHVRATWQYDYFDSKKNPKEPPVLKLPETLTLQA